MRGSLLTAVGVAVAVLLVIGGVVVSGMFGPDREALIELEAQAEALVVPTPADRYASHSTLRLEDDDELGSLEVYTVGADGDLEPPPQGLRQAIWDLVLTIMTPADTVQTIGSFKVADAPGSERTAWVTQHRRRADDWVLGVNLATVTTAPQAAATLIHEYAHLLSLRGGQVVPAGDRCTTVRLPEGCIRPGGYLAAFEAAFWREYGDSAPGPANADPAAAKALYRKRPGAFVSEYAAMNVAEDFAESFAAYVHTAAPDDAYGGKLAFFDHYEEMSAIRERIRADLGDVLGTFEAG